MHQKIENIIKNLLHDFNEELENENLICPNSETKLYGGNGALDSLGLVSFITDLEDQISEEFGKVIVLADEKAMSQKTSPFRTVSTLILYIEKILTN
jgi:acyl carrier protein